MSLSQLSKPDASIVVSDYVGLGSDRPRFLNKAGFPSLPLGVKEQRNHTKRPMLVLLAVEGRVYARKNSIQKKLNIRFKTLKKIPAEYLL